MIQKQNKQKLVVVIMGQDNWNFINMCIESIRGCDGLVICDGGSSKEYLDYLVEKTKGFNPFTIIRNIYNQEDIGMNGKQRNFYLNYLKQNYPDDWALVLDADEVVDEQGIERIKAFIQIAQPGLYSPKMRHFQQDLGHEDATVPEHFVLNRLFKISEAGEYPEVEHPVLQPKIHIIPEGQEIPQVAIFKTDVTTIWHLAYIPNLWDIKKRYDNHMKKSNMHTPQFLHDWYYAHLFGTYPKNEVNQIDIPEVILNEFGIDKDEFYFKNRGVELKHPIMVKQWNDYFKPESVLDLGCGRGPYLYFWKWYCEARGIELSKWAVNNAFTDKIRMGDITNEGNYLHSDLITAIDVLEHLNNTELDITLRNIAKHGNKFLFSIPFIGDPNLLNDKTHKQFRTKEEWIKLIESHDIKIKETPIDWLFANQLLIGTK